MKWVFNCFVLLFAFNLHAKLKIVSYNVENLFDTLHDPGKEDFTFTPLGTLGRKAYCLTIENEYYRKQCLEMDWTSEKLKIKLAKIKEVIGSISQIDVLALVEVENENVIKMLAKKLGFNHYLVTDSPDKRGIDVAFLYNEKLGFEFSKSYEHRLKGEYFKAKPTRDILEAEFIYQNEKINIFVNHWPSQSAPGWVRTSVAQQIKKVVDKRISENRHVIMTGDFNVIDGDSPHPFKSVLMRGDKDLRLTDIHHLQLKVLKETDYGSVNKVPLGTYFYGSKMQWNLLDRFFVSPKLLDGKKMEVNILKYKIHVPLSITTTYTYSVKESFNFGTSVMNVPLRYDHNAKDSLSAGYSDHFPIILELN